MDDCYKKTMDDGCLRCGFYQICYKEEDSKGLEDKPRKKVIKKEQLE